MYWLHFAAYKTDIPQLPLLFKKKCASSLLHVWTPSWFSTCRLKSRHPSSPTRNHPTSSMKNGHMYLLVGLLSDDTTRLNISRYALDWNNRIFQDSKNFSTMFHIQNHPTMENTGHRHKLHELLCLTKRVSMPSVVGFWKEDLRRRGWRFREVEGGFMWILQLKKQRRF